MQFQIVEIWTKKINPFGSYNVKKEIVLSKIRLIEMFQNNGTQTKALEKDASDTTRPSSHLDTLHELDNNIFKNVKNFIYCTDSKVCFFFICFNLFVCTIYT